MKTIYIDFYSGEYVAHCHLEGTKRHLSRDNDLSFCKKKAMKYYFGSRWKEHENEVKFVETFDEQV